MINLSKEICLKFKEARIAKDMNQSALAKAVGCHQSAISMFEGGMTTKLSDETVRKLSEYLGVPLETPAKDKNAEHVQTVGSQIFTAEITRGYCPNCHCPSNVPYTVDGRLFYRPSRKLASPAGGLRCVQCGELLETRCPTCGAPLNDGACCAVCGSAYVTPVLPEDMDLMAYARIRREEILQLRSLS